MNRIREALWQQPEGCASVMVGAGFSRNAKKAGPDAGDIPLWWEVATSLCTRLYPSGDGDRLRQALAEASGTSGFLRLAQEYEAAFGRVALHSLIREVVPDDDYVPGDMHVRLLRLPWRDVFTTNWETLLERTLSFVADRAYGVVRTADEIPTAQRPRIVKLHGSFPAHLPFIFTEEDYRTYPKKFAPFVNTVQQVMMETVFCLIGFSGDDPNFLHWLGWVRDNLGESAPKIYLAGWLDLSPHRRRMLEDRNVVPIDLSRHPQAMIWPEHLRHQYATEWILHTLERGRPYDVTEWPSPPDWGHSLVPDFLQPVEDVTVNAPMKEPDPPARGAEPVDLPDLVCDLISVWEYNRKVYPGWLVIPPNKHFGIERSMHEWELAILRAIPELQSIERLSAMRELIWRREKLLEPLSGKIEAAAQAILDDIDCTARKIGGAEDRSAQWADIREAWRDLAMALLTAARQRFDRDTFDDRLAALGPFIDDLPDVAQRVHQEKCLLALSCLDFSALEELLKEWKPEGCDPAWMTRKAAILAETNRNEEAVRLLNRSLSIIREAPRCGDKLASASCEGWTLWLALAYDRKFLPSTDEVVEAPPAFRRWAQLASLQCDAFAQKRDLLNVLRGNPEKTDGPLFDFGVSRGETVRFSNSEYEKWVAARRAVRLCEVVGLPPSASSMMVASDILALAVDRLVTTDYALASRLALRLANSEDDATFNRTWARSRIAGIPTEEVDALVGLLNNVITYALPRATSVGTSSQFWITRLRVAMDALSRLVLRLPPECAEGIFKRALKYYRIEGVVTHPWLYNAAAHLLTRSWEALPNCRRAGLVFDVLSAPIAGLDGFKTFQYYPDPGTLLANNDETPAPDRVSETEGRWVEIVHLTVRGLRTDGEARERAALRLIPLVRWGRLTPTEMDIVAQALWQPDRYGLDSLPNGTTLYDWGFLSLPEPEPGLAEKLFRRKWLGSQKPEGEKQINNFFWNVGTALASLRRSQRPLTLTEEECANLTAIVEEWIKFPVSLDDHPFVKVGTHKGVEGLQSILPEIDLSPSAAEDLLGKASALNQTNTPGFRLFSGLAKSLPNQLEEIAISMRMGLSSDNVAMAEEAVIGLHSWVSATSGGAAPTPPPPGDLLREIGVMIASRRKGVLNRSLQLARWIFTSGSAEQRDAIAQSTLHGLRYLIEELSYDRDHGEVGEEDIPLLRWGCAHLALAMLAAGFEDDPTVTRWAEVVQDDPLPEVRHAEVPALARTGAEISLGN